MAPGGKAFNAKEFYQGQLRADLCAIALTHCFEHGTHVIDEILARYDVTRKPMRTKEIL